MKQVLKYGTGDAVPDDAQYLTTVVQEIIGNVSDISKTVSRFVWHYFLVNAD